MQTITTIGPDIANLVFQVYRVDGAAFTYRESRRLRNICCVLAAMCFGLTKNAPGPSFPCRSLTRPRDGE